jgi:bacterioferritin (cytochrome b1)
MSYATLEFMEGARKRAWDTVADYTPDIYEHAIGAVEKIAYETEQQLNLIKEIGLPAYIAARLDD